jgi:hypothetical protein
MERIATTIMLFKDNREFTDCIASQLLHVRAELWRARRLDAFLAAAGPTRATRRARQPSSIFSRRQTHAARFWRSTLAGLSDMPSQRL